VSNSIARRAAWACVAVAAACREAPTEPVDPTTPGGTSGKPPVLMTPIVGGSDAVRQRVIRFFAPLIYQDVEDRSEADLITRVTFDGNWKGTDNWEHTFLYPKRAYVYTSLIEDASRYFLHYGLFWPRDWCGGLCWAGNDYHENDMEGLTLVIDKRFTTPGWPFGQVLTLETRHHNGIKRYRNCALAGGYPMYVQLRSNFGTGCIPFQTYQTSSTFPNPPNRVAVYANSQSHAVRALESGDYPFAGGDGVVYYPTEGAAQVPASVMYGQPTGYAIQWMDSTETNAWTFWSQRYNNVITVDNNLYQSDGSIDVGPHDVYYLKHLGCNDNCPWLASTRAKAPWGIRAGDSEHIGDWHNHPAYSWTRYWAPVSGLGSWFDYTCMVDTCRQSVQWETSYRHNIYWDDRAWVNGSLSDQGGGGSSCFRCPKMTPGVERPHRHGAEHRWDFDDQEGVQLSGDGVMELVTVADEDWGYADGNLEAIRIRGQGRVSLTFELPVDPARIDQAVVRARRARGRPASVTAEWLGETPTGTQVIRQATMTSHSISAHDWEMLHLDLREAGAWKELRSVRRFSLVFSFDGGPADAVDLDFVILAP
jgi:hypothetical protein